MEDGLDREEMRNENPRIYLGRCLDRVVLEVS